MAGPLNRLLERIVLAEQRAVAPIAPNIRVLPYFNFVNGGYFPYFTNRISDVLPPDGMPADLTQELYTVEMRLVIGHLKGDYAGQDEGLLYQLLPLVNAAFINDHWLAGDDEIVLPELSAVGVQFTRGRGLIAMQVSGIEGVFQIGTMFTLDVDFTVENDRYAHIK